MSSPTINLTGATVDTSLAAIMNLVRSLVNDTLAGATSTPGEGQIITNSPVISPFTLPLLNSAIREVYRELRNAGQPALIKDNVILSGITPINSPSYGPGHFDNAVQVRIDQSSYFDGVNIDPNIMLPSDIVVPERLWERSSGTNDQFLPMRQPQFGLPSRPQQPTLAEWEWRGEAIWMVGSTETRDIRLRYYCALPTFFSPTLDFESTFVPIIDCTEAVAYKTAYKYAMSLLGGGQGAAGLKADGAEAMRQLRLIHVRRAQSIDYQRIPYGRMNGGPGNDSNGASWGDGGQ